MIVLESMCTHMNSKTVPSPHGQTHETQLMPGTEVVSALALKLTVHEYQTLK